jgi:branched-subunit amino acid aminotransferase/4-amino-4-deoxychorismate lyase
VIWVRGAIVADDALAVSVLDRTFEHGIGLFETFRTWNGHVTLLQRHLDRLRASARVLGLPLDPAALPDEEAVRALGHADGHAADARFRITLSGGVSATAGSTLWMRSFPLGHDLFEEGLVLGPVRPARTDPLAVHKTLNYWPNRRMFEDARADGFDECVTLTPDGNLWECSRSNLFAVVDGEVLTPPCDGKVLPGIMRALILEQGCLLGLPIREAPLGLMDATFRPDEVFLTNAVRGIMPVRKWGEARFPAPGPMARRLWDEIRAWLESGGGAT